TSHIRARTTREQTNIRVEPASCQVCYGFGAYRLDTVTLLTITALPGKRSCGTATARFSGHAATFRSWPTVFAETPTFRSVSTRMLFGNPPRAMWSAATFFGL